MAKSGTIYGSPASNGNYLYIEWSESNVSTANNSSTVTATLYLYNPYGSYSETACPWALTIDGTTTSGSTSFSGSTVTLGSASKTITHGSDGKKTISISASFDTQGTSTGVVYAEGSAVLSDIGVPPTCSQSLGSKTGTSITMNWSSDSTIDHYWYSTDNGSTWKGKDITGAKSGSYTITGLSPNTTYKVITSVRKKGTTLWTNSSMLSVTTYNYPTVTQSLTSRTGTAITVGWSSNVVCDLIWYSKDNGTTWTKKDITDGKSGTFSFSSLTPNTTYKIKVKVRGKSSQLTKESSALTVTTYGYPTVTQAKSTVTASSIKITWTANVVIDYVWYSKDNGSTWTAVGSVEAKTGNYTISGLSKGTTYKIKTRARGKSSQLKDDTTALSVTTYAYPTVTQSVSSKTDKTITMNWSSDQTIDYIWYSKNDGSTWTGIDVTDGNSGTYTIKSLTAGTTYKIKTRVRAKSTQLTKDSSALSVKTYPSNYFTLTLAKKGSSTVSSFKVLATTSNTQSTSTVKEYSYKWTHYPSGKPKEAVTANSNNVATCNSQITRTFSNLLPNTEYTVQAVLYKGTVASGTVMFTKSVTVKTQDVGGTFNYTARTSSVIKMALSGVAKLPYTTRVKMSYKNSKNTKWVLKNTTNIEADESKNISYMFTGLKANSTYNFKAELYKVDGTKETLLKTYTADADTLVFVPDADSPVPSIDDYISVPHAGKATFKASVSQSLGQNMFAYLYKSNDGETFTKGPRLTGDLVNGYWINPFSGTLGASRYFKIVIEDANGVQHNESDIVEIPFTDLTWRVRDYMEPLDIEADNIKEWAEALLELYRYDKVVGQAGTQGDIYDKDRFYNILLTLMDTLNEGLPIVGEKGSFINPQGSAIQVMEYLAVAFIEASTGEEWWAVDATSGTPIGAINMNSVIADLRTALETII